MQYISSDCEHTPVSFPSVGDPHLLPINNILVAHFHSSCFDAGHIRSCPRLSDTVRLQKTTQELNWKQQHRLSLHVCCFQHTVVKHRVYGLCYKINKAWRYNKKHSELPCYSKSPTQTNFPSFVTIYSIKGIKKQTNLKVKSSVIVLVVVDRLIIKVTCAHHMLRWCFKKSHSQRS